MQAHEIQEIKIAINTRKLRKALLARLRIERPTLSNDSISRAFEVENFEEASDLLKVILNTARQMKLADDERIQREIAALELGQLVAA